MSAHAYLRAVTRDAHRQVDALFADFDLAKRGDYARFLTSQAAAFLPIEQALDAADAASLLPDWAERRRSEQLRGDLAELGILLPCPVSPPPFATADDAFGAIYVLEGSRLGGAMLSRSIGEGLPRRFLAGRRTSGGWKALVALLEHNLPSVVQRERAGRSAVSTFDCFMAAAEAVAET